LIHVHKCLRCDYEWASRNPHPIRCAECKTPYWDKEKKAIEKGKVKHGKVEADRRVIEEDEP